MTNVPTTPPAAACPRCGSPFPDGAPAALCPRCVLAEAAAAAAAPTTPESRGPYPSLERVAAAFPQLEIHDWIGSGGMGFVLKARQPRLDRWVALKLLPETLGQNPVFAERFHREARVLARLNHPNIVTVHDFGQADGFCFLLMEYVDGVNLREAMRAGRFSPAEALELVPRICEALQFAHEEGVLHRDIKPENILLDARGRVKIADFGIAKLVGEVAPEITLTRSGAAVGTPQYMAPEQIEHPGDVDHRADIYSLGVVFYELLTGELPIGRFAPPSGKVDLDRRIDDIVLRALAKERELRQQSAREVRTEVEGVRDRPAPPPPAAPPAVPVPSASAASAPPPIDPRTPEKASPSEDSRPDFILCNPRLPRMAQAITVYTLVLSPLASVLGYAVIRYPTLHSPYAQFIELLMRWVDYGTGTLLLGLMFLGGWRLRNLDPSGPRILRWAFWLFWGCLALSIAGSMFWNVLEQTWRIRAIPRLSPFINDPADLFQDLLLLPLALGTLAFQLVAQIWLYRNRQRLEAICANGPNSRPDHANPADAPPKVSGTARNATRAATWTTTSLLFGVPLLAILARVFAISRSSGADFNLSPVAWVIGVVAAGCAVVCGRIGFTLGLGALREIRAADGTLGGARRAMFGALTWPLAAALALVMLPIAWGGYHLGASLGLALLGGGLFAAVLGEIASRQPWHWLHADRPRSQHRPVPDWNHAWVVGTLLLTAAALVPAGATWLQQAIVFEATLPTLQLLEPPARPASSPTASATPAGTALESNRREFRFIFPGYSLAWIETELVVSPSAPPREGAPPTAWSTTTARNAAGALNPKSAWNTGVQGQRPYSQMHVANAGAHPVEAPLVLRIPDAPAGESETWELVFLAEDGPLTFTAPSTPLPNLRWHLAAPPDPEFIRPDEPARFAVLEGRAADGSTATVLLHLRIEPLPADARVPVTTQPSHPLALRAGHGSHWQATLRR